MIPLIAKVSVRHSGWPRLSIWLPLFLIWVLLLPVVLLLLPFFLLACLITLINPLRPLKIFWEILASTKGTHIYIEELERDYEITIK